ncbi:MULTISPECIES: hypothetical protein [unclassified Aeromicrobium]|uniref:hypothetical protein n=1 Tax=unclassified Aeromicrobium TaxID=2633570 RepID=UPI00396AF8EC
MGELIAALVALAVPSTARCDALAALDVVRALAWTSGDERMLATGYTEGAGADDADRLRAWAARGIRLEGARTLRKSCRERGAHDVEVVERLGPTVAVLPDGSRQALPADAWDRRIVELGHRDGWWRIERVR